ncbi:unnamed protein product [Soboliphyme baturini]|uniref:FAM184 domain-containing protein n=1 Tax=Soboliphyme baturini TaxID=241478 RepID=A0A183IQ46_9BILA|nr:unnamed protein product [Soboliphyme baturini]
MAPRSHPGRLGCLQARPVIIVRPGSAGTAAAATVSLMEDTRRRPSAAVGIHCWDASGDSIVFACHKPKFGVMGTFAEYRDRVAERERKLEAEYSAKIISLSEEVLAAKKDFEERMKQFQALQREIQLLEQRCSEAQLLNLEQKYIIEIKRLEEERKSLRTEKEKMNETYEDKFNRAQSLYESELSTAKSLYSKELEALTDHEKALKEELTARQEEFKDRLEDSQYRLQQTKEEFVTCQRQVLELQTVLKLKEQEIDSVTKQAGFYSVM